MRKTTPTISQSVSSLLRPKFVRNVKIFRTSENDHTAVSVWVGVTDEHGSGVYFELILTFQYEIGENFRASMRSIFWYAHWPGAFAMSAATMPANFNDQNSAITG